MDKPDVTEHEVGIQHDNAAVAGLMRLRGGLLNRVSSLSEDINDHKDRLSDNQQDLDRDELALRNTKLKITQVDEALASLDPEQFAHPVAVLKPERWIICVDFDGCLHEYSSGWQGIDVIADPPVEGAIDWLMQFTPLTDDYSGPVAMIYSSRSKESIGILAMQEWLVEWGYPQEYIDQGYLKFPTQKPAAFLTIDDRAICFRGRFPTKEEMMSFKPWNK